MASKRYVSKVSQGRAEGSQLIFGLERYKLYNLEESHKEVVEAIRLGYLVECPAQGTDSQDQNLINNLVSLGIIR